MKQLKNQRGLTLVELLAVIVILAIIAAIAAVAIGNVINNSKDKGILADAANIINGAKIAYIDDACGDGKGKTDVTCSAEDLKPFVDIASDKMTDVSVAIAQGAKGEVTYTVTYPLLEEIKNDKYKVGGKSAEESVILDKMNTKNSTANKKD